jgi:hypothetical protein
VHFLLNSKTENAERIDALLAELAAGTTRLRAVERAFDGVDWRELERELREHVAALR